MLTFMPKSGPNERFSGQCPVAPGPLSLLCRLRTLGWRAILHVGIAMGNRWLPRCNPPRSPRRNRPHACYAFLVPVAGLGLAPSRVQRPSRVFRTGWEITSRFLPAVWRYVFNVPESCVSKTGHTPKMVTHRHVGNVPPQVITRELISRQAPSRFWLAFWMTGPLFLDSGIPGAWCGSNIGRSLRRKSSGAC